MNMILDAGTATRATEVLLSAGILIASLEFWQLRATLLQDHGLLSWRVQRLRHPVFASIVAATGIGWLLGRGFSVILLIRICFASLLLWTAVDGGNDLLPLLGLTVSGLLVTLRCAASNDGSDQIGAITLLALTLGKATLSDRGQIPALIFIVAQAALAYGTSGFLKLPETGWRDGSFVSAILETSSFGNKTLAGITQRYPLVATALGWGVVIGDCALSVASLSPPPICLALLGYGILLHLGIARVLGLNTFFWSFVATFPPTFWASVHLYGWRSPHPWR